MKSNVTTCSICSISYAEKVGRPLVPPCSHSFCQACLGQLKTGMDRICPACKSLTEEHIPTDSTASRIVSKDASVCNDHKLEESVWCNTCKISVCKNGAEELHKECDRSSDKQEEDSTGRVESRIQSKDLGDCVSSAPEEGGGWSISDATLASDADFALQATDARPSFVTVTGTRWREGVLLQFLSRLSNVECPVYLTPRDTLWRPSDEGKKTSRARIETLLAKGHMCKLVFLWGALDLSTLCALPKSVTNVGIAMITRDDMRLVYELDRWGHQLDFIHFSFAKTFLDMDWGMRTLTPTPDTKISICLHFPELHEDDVEWMLSVISAVVPSDKEKSSVWGLYFPGTSLTADAALDAVTTARLQCKLFLPATRALEGGEKKKVVKKYKRHQCSVEWILEDI